MSQSFLNNHKKFLESAVKGLTPPFPRRIMLEITNRCNHQCIFCAHSSMTRKKVIMDLDLCEKILAECHELGSNECALHGGSEPFLHPNIDKIIALTKKYKYSYVYLSTNGTACTKEKMTAALEAGLDSIKFSINGGTPEEYKKIHGVDGFNYALNMLDHVIAWRENHNRKFKIYISSIQCSKNKDLPTLKEKYAHLIDAVEIIDAVWTGKKTNLPHEEQQKITKCSEIFHRTTFTADGGMRICCNDADNYLLVGSIADNVKNISTIWNGELYIKMRECFLHNTLPHNSLCHACLMFEEHAISPLTECFFK